MWPYSSSVETSGITAALEAVEYGKQVILIEKKPSNLLLLIIAEVAAVTGEAGNDFVIL